MKQSPTPRRTGGARQAAAADPLFDLLHAAEVLQQRIDDALGAVGLSLAKYGVLQTLAGAKEPLTLTDLADQQRCVRSNITQLVDRLEADGLVKRVDDRSDRRSIRATLTAAGRERQAAGARALAAVQKELAHVATASDRAAISRLVSALK